MVSDTCFSANHPDLMSTSSSVPQSSPCLQSAHLITLTLMVMLSMMFLVRISTSLEGIISRGSTVMSLTRRTTSMCLSVCVDGRNMLCKAGTDPLSFFD